MVRHGDHWLELGRLRLRGRRAVESYIGIGPRSWDPRVQSNVGRASRDGQLRRR